MRHNCTCSAGGTVDVLNVLNVTGGELEFRSMEFGMRLLQKIYPLQLNEEIEERFKVL